MRILLDTNIILDIFLEREPFADPAARIWKAHETKRLVAHVSAITPVNVFYIARKLRDRETARLAVTRLLATLPVAPINHGSSNLPWRSGSPIMKMRSNLPAPRRLDWK